MLLRLLPLLAAVVGRVRAVPLPLSLLLLLLLVVVAAAVALLQVLLALALVAAAVGRVLAAPLLFERRLLKEQVPVVVRVSGAGGSMYKVGWVSWAGERDRERV